MTLEEVLKNSTYQVSNELYNVAKVNPSFQQRDYFLMTQDEIETTIIYKQSVHPVGILEEKRNYVLIGINVAVPFYAPGFIASISSAFGNQGISVLVVSTYSRDYFLVSNKYANTVETVLGHLGIKRTAQ